MKIDIKLFSNLCFNQFYKKLVKRNQGFDLIFNPLKFWIWVFYKKKRNKNKSQLFKLFM